MSVTYFSFPEFMAASRRPGGPRSGSVRRLGSSVWLLLCLLVMGLGSTAAAEAFPEGSAHALVQSVTDDLIETIESHRGEFETNPAPFLATVDDMMQDVVDFPWIVRNVMGPYHQQAEASQVERFARVFRSSLIETYGHGLMNFSDETIEVVPPREDQAVDARRVSVTQRIRAGGNVYPIVYSMAQNREGEWKMLNVIINGINLGVTFRNQFQQAAQREQGDLDRVISGWSPEVNVDIDNGA